MTVGAVAPAASAARVHVTDTFPAFEHTHPAPAADTNVTPAGNVSTTDRFAASDGPLSLTTRLYVTVPPAVTDAGPVLTTARSADALTTVTTVELLFPGTGSAVVLDTDAVFDRLPACAGAVTTTVTSGAVVPVASTARVHVTDTLPVFVHTHPAPAADTNVTPAGSVSVTDTFAASDGPLSTTDSVYVTFEPAATVAGPVFVIARSALAVTVVLTVELLLAGTGSAVVLDTDAVLDRLAACAGAVTTTVTSGAVVPVASAGRVHVTDTLPVFVHTHPAPPADTNTTPAGNVSVTDTATASDGPLSTTDSEYVTFAPATTDAGPVLVRARSADPVTPVEVDEVLFAGFGSAVVEDTDAVFVNDPACAGAVTTTVMVGAVTPDATDPTVQVTDTFPVLEHTHPGPAADTNVTPAGSVSVTSTFAASEGPLLLTTRL